MIRKNVGIVTALAAMLCTAALSHASIRIDFSDEHANPDTGFRISNPDTVGLSELVELGSNSPGNADGVSFQRITSATNGISGADVVQYIVVLPELRITNDLGMMGPFNGFEVEFANGGGMTSTATFGNLLGLRIYAASDTNLTTPLMIADMNLFQNFITVGASGFIEAQVEMNLSNVRLGAGVLEPTLVEFKATADIAELSGNPANGPDFNFLITTSGTDIAAAIRAGSPPVVGSANGSIFAEVPEPGTITLLGLAGLAFARRRRTA